MNIAWTYTLKCEIINLQYKIKDINIRQIRNKLSYS